MQSTQAILGGTEPGGEGMCQGKRNMFGREVVLAGTKRAFIHFADPLQLRC